MRPLQLSPVRAEGRGHIQYSRPRRWRTRRKVTRTRSRNILDDFNGRFGPLPESGMKIAQLPDGTVAGYAAPGLLLVGAHQWTAQPNARLLANLAAQQWWGNRVAGRVPF